jgi:CheY-like chemotaxis protein
MRRRGKPVPRILVADDNSNIQKMVTLAFQERGVDVTAVGNGEAAVRRLPDLNPDLVLADVFMPVRNGYEVCEFIKKDQRFAHIPVILLVGAFDPLDEKEARRVGADGVLKKPFVPPDPLIAMVLSALEKNPRVAAEMAKAKEVAAAPPPPPLPELEIAAKTEPKPLPDFPEPSAEEAAVIYGFGKGVRALDDEDLPKAGMEPKAPVAEADEEESEEVDAKKDWRRSARDFEMPDADAARPALSADEDLDAAMFPSERDVPPKHIKVRDLIAESEAAVAAVAPSIQVQTPAPAPWTFQKQDEPVPALAVTEPQISESFDEKPAPMFVQKSEPAPVHASAPEPAIEVVSAAPVSTELKKIEQPIVEQPKVAHWMDMMTPIPAGGSSSGDWMSALMASAVAEPRPSAVKPPVLPEPAVHTMAETMAPSVPEPVDGPVIEVHVAASELPSQPEPLAVAPAQSVQSFEDTSAWSSIQVESEEPFFADDLVESHAPGADSDLLVTQPDLPVASDLKDPELDGPVAVRVIPEPDLVNDDVSGPSDYGSHPEETSPLHSFDVPAAEASSQDEPYLKNHDQPVPDTSAQVAETVHSELARRLFEPQVAIAPLQEAESNHFGAHHDEWSGRIPTAPPASREELSDIPFLVPPPPTQINSTDNGVNAETVDAIVRKVLAQIESQIHGILSPDTLKPLVENLLENELVKKGK